MGIVDAKGLVSVLRDRSARWDERDDAATDLGQSDDTESLMALLAASRQFDDDPIILASIGAAIAEIAARTGRFEPQWLDGMAAAARDELRSTLAALQSDLLRGGGSSDPG